MWSEEWCLEEGCLNVRRGWVVRVFGGDFIRIASLALGCRFFPHERTAPQH